MHLKFKKMAAPLLWAAIIFILYAIPGYRLQYNEPFDLIRLDKLAHLFMFLVFAFLIARSALLMQSKPAKAFLLATIIAVTYGGILEGFQGQWFVQRTTDLNDFYANSIGALVGGPIALLWSKFLLVRRNKRDGI